MHRPLAGCAAALAGLLLAAGLTPTPAAAQPLSGGHPGAGFVTRHGADLKLDAKTLMMPSWTEPSPEPPAPPLDADDDELNSPLSRSICGSSIAVPTACAAVVMNVDAASAPAEQPRAHTPTIHCDARIMSFAFSVTAKGAGLVFYTRRIPPRQNKFSLELGKGPGW